MRLNYTTHSKIQIDEGKVAVMATNNPVVYRDLVFGLRGKNDLVKLFDDDFNEISLEKNIDWLGDVADADFDVKEYVSDVSKMMMCQLSEEDRQKTIEAIQNLYRVVQTDLFMVDLPLQVTMDLDLKKTINFCKIHFDESVMNDPYGIIESVIKVHEECDISECIALTNVSHYLEKEKFEDLVSLIRGSTLSMVLIEFTELECQEFYKDCDFAYIDQDFVDWQSEG